MSDAEVYVPRERVTARMVRKPEDVVTSSGRVQVPRYSYVVERERRDDFGNAISVVEIYSNDEFNEAFAKLDWRAEDRQAAYDEGYEAAKAQHAEADDYERGWADAVKYHNITDNGPVSEGPVVAATPEQAEQAPAPVGDKLETEGPVSKREGDDSGDDSGTSVNEPDRVSN